MPNRPFIRWSGIALAAGGVLTFFINGALTPLLPRNEPFVRTAASALFVWRQSASAVAALLLLVGAVGLYFAQSERAGRFASIAFITALAGNALLLAWEWVDIFILHDLALRAPSALEALESGRHPTLYDLGAMIPLVMFSIGWLLLAAATIHTRVLDRRPATLVIIGFFALPVLGGMLGIWGVIAGNLILGAGWAWMGYEVARAASSWGSSAA